MSRRVDPAAQQGDRLLESGSLGDLKGGHAAVGSIDPGAVVEQSSHEVGVVTAALVSGAADLDPVAAGLASGVDAGGGSGCGELLGDLGVQDPASGADPTGISAVGKQQLDSRLVAALGRDPQRPRSRTDHAGPFEQSSDDVEVAAEQSMMHRGDGDRIGGRIRGLGEVGVTVEVVKHSGEVTDQGGGEEVIGCPGQ